MAEICCVQIGSSYAHPKFAQFFDVAVRDVMCYEYKSYTILNADSLAFWRRTFKHCFLNLSSSGVGVVIMPFNVEMRLGVSIRQHRFTADHVRSCADCIASVISSTDCSASRQELIAVVFATRCDGVS